MSNRTEELKIRISPEDKERIKLKMEDAGILTMSAYVRKMALDGICIRLDLKDVRQLTVMLRRCSDNLNQYAKRANETGSIYAADIEDLQNRLDEIWELSRQLLASLAQSGSGKRYRPAPFFFFQQGRVCRFSGSPRGASPACSCTAGTTAFVKRTRSQPRLRG